MKWPWQRLERRESSYTDALVQAIIAQNSGSRTVATATATAAMESAAGIIGRSFAAADVGGPAPVTAALTPARLNMVGRTLIRKGEFAAYLDVVDGLLTITPASDWDVTGGYDPADWTYRLNLAGPSRSITRSNVRGESVLHVMYSADPETPWRGVGPIGAARIAGRLSAETAQALADEASRPRGSLFWAFPGKTALTAARNRSGAKFADSRAKSGRSSRAKHGQTTMAQTRGASGHRIARFPCARLSGDAPRARDDGSARRLRRSPELVSGGDGTSLREPYRRLLHSTITPLGRILQSELRAKVGAGIALSFDSLFAADLSGRARAFQSMVGGGMSVERADGGRGNVTGRPSVQTSILRSDLWVGFRSAFVGLFGFRNKHLVRLEPSHKALDTIPIQPRGADVHVELVGHGNEKLSRIGN